MPNVQTIADALNRWAPKNIAEEWDNVGLLIGDPTAPVDKILVTLDISDRSIERAIEIGAGMIVTHHPMIFRPLKNIRVDLPQGRRVRRLLKNDIAVFAAHTNLDSTVGGVNDVLATMLGLSDVRPIERDAIEPTLGRIGRLPNAIDGRDVSAGMTLSEFAAHVKRTLRAEYVRTVDAGGGRIKTVGLCGGAGAEFILKAKFHGADVFVTGDVKYHEAQAAADHGIHVVDAGHFFTERPIVDEIARRLRAELDGLTVETFDEEVDVFSII